MFSHPKYYVFQVQAKISTNMTPVFPDHLSVSYDCDARNLDEYFQFYGIASQKLKIKEKFEEIK